MEGSREECRYWSECNPRANSNVFFYLTL